MVGLILFQCLIAFAYGVAVDNGHQKREHYFDHCPNGSVRHDSSCYKVSHDLASWTDSLVFCEAYGGHLARIDSDKEQNFIAGHLKNFLSSSTDPGHYFWIGGTDAMSEGEWYWARIVEPITYTNWKPGEPNNNGAHVSKHQDCMAIYGETGLWDDGWCEERHNFICEIEQVLSRQSTRHFIFVLHVTYTCRLISKGNFMSELVSGASGDSGRGQRRQNDPLFDV